MEGNNREKLKVIGGIAGYEYGKNKGNNREKLKDCNVNNTVIKHCS